MFRQHRRRYDGSLLLVVMREVRKMRVMCWRWVRSALLVAGLDEGLEELLAEWKEDGRELEVLNEDVLVEGSMLLLEVDVEGTKVVQFVLRKAVNGLGVAMMFARLTSHFAGDGSGSTEQRSVPSISVLEGCSTAFVQVSFGPLVQALANYAARDLCW